MKYLLLLTTSRRPSYRTRSFIKDLEDVLPYTIRVHRGKKTLYYLAFEAKRYGAKYIWIVGERKGNPSRIEVYRVGPFTASHLIDREYSILLRGVKLSREKQVAYKAYNVEKLGVDINNCSTDNCYKLGDLFIEVFRDILETWKPDLWIVLNEDNREGIEVAFRTPTGKEVGPSLKVYGVIEYGGSVNDRG